MFVRMLTEPHRLSQDQRGVLYRDAIRVHRLAISAVTLVEIATRSSVPAKVLGWIESIKVDILPVNVEIAREVAVMGDSLKDPNDRVIVATARIHGLRLVTSDQRIIDSGLVPVVE